METYETYLWIDDPEDNPLDITMKVLKDADTDVTEPGFELLKSTAQPYNYVLRYTPSLFTGYIASVKEAATIITHTVY